MASYGYISAHSMGCITIASSSAAASDGVCQVHTVAAMASFCPYVLLQYCSPHCDTAFSCRSLLAELKLLFVSEPPG